MRRSSKISVVAFVIGLIILLFFSCVKFPENSVSKHRVKRTLSLGGYITRYEVNGIDSLEKLNTYFTHHPGATVKVKDVRRCLFEPFEDDYTIWHLDGCGYAQLREIYSADYTEMKIEFMPDEGCYRKNIFISHEVSWRILHFHTKKEPYLKMQALLDNGNVYTIQFD